MENEKNEEKKAHIYEIDFLRAITVFSVVTIHSFATTAYLYSKSSLATSIIGLLIHMLHYNREMFIFVTGLVLTYVYYHRPFSAKKFWLKRFLLIFVPYVLWTLIYIKVNNNVDFTKYLSLSWTDILTGNASYQLYYILLALQYYAIFPFFLWFIKKVKNHPLTVLFISFFVQLVLIYIDFNFFQRGPLTHLAITKNFLSPYQDRLFITYQFFFIFGAIVAIYMNKAYKLLQEYGKFLPSLLVITLVCYALYFSHQLLKKEPISYALSVLQPSVVVYSTVVIPFFAWISTLWVKRKKMFGVIKAISDTSFGIFFVHVLLLNFIAQNILPKMSSAIPTFVKVISVDVVTFSLSLIFCLLVLRTPVLSWTIGRVGKKM